MQSSRVPKSSSTASSTGTSVTASRVPQPELAAGQRQQGSFVGLSTTIHTPESALIPATYHQQDELGLVSETGITQIAPFEAATHPAVTFDDDHQGRSASSLSLSNEPAGSQKSSQPVDDASIMREEQNPDPTDKWIVMSGDKKKPFKCGYKGCGRKYSKKASLQTHLVTHAGDSKSRCLLGDCADIVIYPNTRALTQHSRVTHAFEKPFRCELCNRRFRRDHHLKYHREHLHSPKAKKKSRKSQSVSESSSATTITNTASTSTMTSSASQPELAAEQRQQGSFVGLSATVHTTEPTHIPASYPQDELRFLSDADLRFISDDLRFLSDLSDIDVSKISTPHIDPFETLATHQTVTFEELDQVQEQEQPDECPLPFDELLQPVDDFDPMAGEDPDEVGPSILPNNQDDKIRNRTTSSIPEQESLQSINEHFRRALSGTVPKAVLTAVAEDPRSRSGHYIAEQKLGPDSTDKWIIRTGDKTKPFKCGYQGCDRRYTRKHDLQLHFIKHTGDSPYKCYLGLCNGRIAYRRQEELTWHIHSQHTFERPYQCEVCSRRFIRLANFKRHRRRCIL